MGTTAMADYRERLQSKMEKEDPDLPPSPYTPIGSQGDERPTPAQQQGREGPQFFAAFAATMGNLVMGTTIGWSSPAGPLLAKPAEDDGFNLTDEENSWVGCLMPAGALLGGQVERLPWVLCSADGHSGSDAGVCGGSVRVMEVDIHLLPGYDSGLDGCPALCT